MGIELLPWVFTTGWASGVNAYATVLVLGLLGRYANVPEIPEGLTRTDVLVVAAILFTLEFVADKIPYVDSLWDAVHTLIRPTVGAVLAALLAGNDTTLRQAIAASVGGLVALASHLTKAGVRAAVNTSPEPASNVIVSSAEDISVATLLALLSLVIAPLLTASLQPILRKLRRGHRRLRNEYGEMTSVLQEAVSGIRLVRSFRGEPYEDERFTRASSGYSSGMVKISEVTLVTLPASGGAGR